MATTTTQRDEKHIFSEFEDPERQKLIQAILDQDSNLAKIPRSCFFALWFSDISRLRSLATPIDDPDLSDDTRDSIRSLRFAMLRQSFDEDVPGIVAGTKKFTTENPEGSGTQGTGDSGTPSPARKPNVKGHRKRSSESSPAPTRSPKAPKTCSGPDPTQEIEKEKEKARERNQTGQTKERDKFKCVLTKQGDIGLEVAHIMPFKLHQSQPEDCWRWLELFWSREKITAWKAQVLGGQKKVNTEQIKNKMTLTRNLHAWWDKPICAFRPIQVDDEGTSMDIAFHWLPAPDPKTSRKSQIPIDQHPYPGLKEGFDEGPTEDIAVWDLKTRSLIPSRHIFTITTDDPVQKPLPSFQLLEMRWILGRIAAMQGAAEDDDDSDMDSDGDSVIVRSSSRSRSPMKSGFRVISGNLPIRRGRSLSPSKEPLDYSAVDESPGSFVE